MSLIDNFMKIDPVFVIRKFLKSHVLVFKGLRMGIRMGKNYPMSYNLTCFYQTEKDGLGKVSA